MMLILTSTAQTVIKEDSVKVQMLQNLYLSDSLQTQIEKIVRTDSMKSDDTSYYIYKSYDSRDSLVQELRYYTSQSNSDRGYLTRNIYNENGKILLYEHLSILGTAIERYKYTYNERGLLIKKEGFGSGEMGISIVYTYSKNGDLIDTKAYRSGQEVKNYFKNKKIK